MKRRVPLTRRARLRATLPLRRRTPLERHTPLPARSIKRAAIAPERAALVEQVLAERPWCQARLALAEAEMVAEPADKPTLEGAIARCGRYATEVHEPRTRARGGDILDPDQCIALDAHCHSWIHQHPRLATAAGLLVPSWERTR